MNHTAKLNKVITKSSLKHALTLKKKNNKFIHKLTDEAAEGCRDGWAALLLSNDLTPETGSFPVLLDDRIEPLLPPYVVPVLDSCSASLYFDRDYTTISYKNNRFLLFAMTHFRIT